MSTGHGHDGHEDLEKIVKLTEKVQGIPQATEMKHFHDESYILTSDLFKQHRRKKLSGKMLDKATDSLFSTLAKQIFTNEFKEGASLYARMNSLGDITETRTGDSYNQMDNVVASLAGFNKGVIKRLLGSSELSPELMDLVTKQVFQSYASVSQERTINSALKSNEDVATAIKYWNGVRKEPGAPSEIKNINFPEDYLKSSLGVKEARELILKAYGALGNYKPQTGTAAHGHH